MSPGKNASGNDIPGKIFPEKIYVGIGKKIPRYYTVETYLRLL